ncbi:MAG TPA: alpha/beta hydrolase domain-containing protein [Methylomirabilota bacterium]|nr:alpha/beta hydrolase domain-containing protein [Methylomirabilota bacterium]
MAVTSLEITRRSLVLDGHAFGDAGAYEKIAGVLRFGVDPTHLVNQAVADLAMAPRAAAGLVESAADFYVLRPVDTARGNRRLLLDVPNRGRKVALGMLNSAVRVPDPTTAEDFGNGFLMRHGYTVAWCGWQHDVPRQDGLMALTVPLARGADGPIAGPVLCEWRPNAPVGTLAMADRYHIAQPTADLVDPAARLTVREHAGTPATAIARTAWRFSDATHVALDGGFEPGKLYELVYRAENPPLVGLGLLAVRDTAAWLRTAGASAGNPCAGELDHAYVIGVSQTGRFLRHLLYLGLNEDEAGRRVFDGVIVHIAGARRGEFNQRFGQPSLNATASVGSLFPFTDTSSLDRVTGKRGAQLARLEARDTVPKIVAVNTAAEYWRGDASLVHSDVEGTRDAEPHPETRLYLFAGCQHTAGTLPPPDADPNTGSRGRHMFNVVDYAPLLRAVLLNLDRWVADGVEPPASAVPRLADGTGVQAEQTRRQFARIPGVRFPDRIERPRRLDFGPDVARGIIHELPPKTGSPYESFVPSVDEDGNDVPGIRPVELAAPLATFTGWNPRHPDQGAPGDLMSMLGSTLPFAATRAAREASGDPRPSIEERYGSRAAYLARAREAAVRLVAARHMLAEDVDAVVSRAGQLWDFIVRA